MAMSRIAPVFVSHGAPTLVLTEGAPRTFLRDLGRSLPRPSAVVCVSAHWQTAAPCVGAAATPSTIHDFFGFPGALYRLSYPARGAPDLAERVAGLLAGVGFDCRVDRDRGLDHGAWAPLMLMFPEADVPVAPLSIQPGRDAAHHVRLGRALASLPDDGVLVLGSGGAVHNLGYYAPGGGPIPAWAVGFEAWLVDTLARGAEADLADWRRRAADAGLAHPEDDHLLPLMVAFGAAGAGATARPLFRGFMDGAIGMTAFAFDAPDLAPPARG